MQGISKSGGKIQTKPRITSSHQVTASSGEAKERTDRIQHTHALGRIPQGVSWQHQVSSVGAGSHILSCWINPDFYFSSAVILAPLTTNI